MDRITSAWMAPEPGEIRCLWRDYDSDYDYDNDNDSDRENEGIVWIPTSAMLRR